MTQTDAIRTTDAAPPSGRIVAPRAASAAGDAKSAGATRILVIDVGGTNVKVGGTGRRAPVKIPSGKKMTAAHMASAVLRATEGWEYDAVSIGYPGPVAHGKPAAEPANLGRGWVRFDYKKAFKKPVRIVNDAAMQALGAYRGSRMLFLGLGTGLGSALVVEGVLVPLELAHLPYRNGRSFEDYVGWRGEKRLGRKKWKKHVAIVVDILRHAMQAEHVVIGGGAAKKLDRLPSGVRLGTNAHAMIGGERLWDGAGRRRAGRGGAK
jgi:polyphosphate glucokinase